MKKAVWGAFVLMTAFAATGLCEMDYTLTNPHIRYEKIEGAQQAEEAAQTDGAGISLSEMAAAQDAAAGTAERGHVAQDLYGYVGRRYDARLDG